MRETAAIVAGVVILAAANWTVARRERLLTEGRVVLLELAPVDPRSLMQGDYMALRFQVASDVFPSAARGDVADGRLVLALDEKGVGRYERLDDGGPLGAGQVLLRYRIRDGQVKLATNAFFFQEGTADLYTAARYGELRVDGNGDALLTGLRGRDTERLGPTIPVHR